MNTNWKGTSRGGRHTGTEKAESTGQRRLDSALPLSIESSRPVSDEKSCNSVLGKVFGVEELAAFFDCSTEKIKRRARAGELPAFKFGKSWFVRQRDLEIYIQRAVELGGEAHGLGSVHFERHPG
jgi:helix-turn-helix protein